MLTQSQDESDTRIQETLLVGCDYEEPTHPLDGNIFTNANDDVHDTHILVYVLGCISLQMLYMCAFLRTCSLYEIRKVSTLHLLSVQF